MRSGDIGKRSKKSLVKHELIGLDVRVAEATDPSHRGMEGRVVDESRQTLRIAVGDREITIPKRGSTFAFQWGGEVLVPGERLLYRPEDRIKKAR